MKPDKQLSQDPDAIDHMLGGEEQLEPSSGFLLSVMERVREEAIAPKPIPFPLKRAIPGIVLFAGTIGWLIYDFIRMALAGTLFGHSTSSIATPHISVAALPTLMPAYWTALALVVSLASWAFSRRLMRRSTLL
jgi:hypothetical protein